MTRSRLTLFSDRLEDRQQHIVHDQEAIPGVVDDVGQFVRMEPEVQRVQDAADDRDPEVGLEVHRVVPHQRGDAIAGAEAEVLQAGREGPRPTVEVAVRAPVRRVVGPL